jgi:hypothetical protein
VSTGVYVIDMGIAVRSRRLRWIRRGKADNVVWINVALLNASWRNDRDYVGLDGRNGISGRYEKFGTWLAEHPDPIWMPEIGFNDDRSVGFTDGRHRFAWLRDRGVKSLPVAIDPGEMPEIKERFGTRSRVSWLPAHRSGGD